MLKIELAFSWRSNDGAPETVEAIVFDLLEAIGSGGSLRSAARTTGLSYRHAWATVGKWAKICGQPLVQLHRGRGASLTEFGSKLLAARQRARTRLADHLDSLSRELATEIGGSARNLALRVHASHDLALIRLRDLFARGSGFDLDLEFHGSLDSLASLARGQCDIAGFHVAVDLLPAEAATFRQWLKPRSQTLIQFVTRRQGLMLAAGNPCRIRGVSDLAEKKVRFINRQRSSGTRVEFDRLLAKAAIDARRIAGYQTEEFTHLAVAATIAGGMADAGFGIEAAAAQFGLDFVPLVSERYFLVCRDQVLKQPAVQKMIELLRSPGFRAEASQLPGYEVSESGNILKIKELIANDPRARSGIATAAIRDH